MSTLASAHGVSREELARLTREQLGGLLDQQGIRHHRLAVIDIDGVLRGKYVDREKFLSAAENGLGFCDVVLGWDVDDQLYAQAPAAGWHTGYRDAPVRVDLSTLRRLPHEPDTVLALGEFDGDYAGVCPRRTLQRVIDHGRSLGLSCRAAFEYEFFLFDETPHSVREKGYRQLRPFTPGMFGYSLLRGSVHHELHQGLIELCEGMDVGLEGLHTETGPGVLEAAIRHDDALAAADKAALFKTFTKVFAQRHGLMATFMAKWSVKVPGQSGHVHMSLQGADGRPVFHDPAGAHGMSQAMRRFVAGQVECMPELMALICPTINSYRRMVPGMWAPLTSCWGVDNRTVAVRVIPGSPGSQRCEYRIGPADANPHLILAAALASGLYGIEGELELGAGVTGSAYDLPVGEGGPAPLPRTLWDATAALRRSGRARRFFGDAFVEHFAATREWEVAAYHRHVSDFDLARYFEII